MLVNPTPKAHNFELCLQTFSNLNWLEHCTVLDPNLVKFETKKLLTSWLNLKGGEGFSSLRT
jgi:hypothetical protein